LTQEAAVGHDREELGDEDQDENVDEHEDELEDADGKGSDVEEQEENEEDEVDDHDVGNMTVLKDGDDGEAQEESKEDLQDTSEAFMEEADLNKDGKISLTELNQLLDGDAAKDKDGPQGDTDKEDLEAVKTDFAALFAKADSNKDGLVDIKELPAMMQLMEKDDDDEEEQQEDHHAQA